MDINRSIEDIDEGAWARLTIQAGTDGLSMSDCGSGQGGELTEASVGDCYHE